jgi:hypothetical protein
MMGAGMEEDVLFPGWPDIIFWNQFGSGLGKYGLYVKTGKYGFFRDRHTQI